MFKFKQTLKFETIQLLNLFVSYPNMNYITSSFIPKAVYQIVPNIFVMLPLNN
jgi:hypothetical protein